MAIAARRFAERGFAGVTVDDIGAASGMSGPALYHHFASKEALLGEMLVSISEHLLDRARRTVAEAADGPAALPMLIRSHARYAVEHPDLTTVQYRDLVHAADRDRRVVRSPQRRYVEIWVDVLVAHRPARSRRTAQAAVHAVLGLLGLKNRVLQAFYDGMADRPHTTFGTMNDDVLAHFDPAFRREDFVEIIRSNAWPE